MQIRGTLFLPRSALSPWCTHVDLEGCILAGEAESADGGGGWMDEDGVCEGGIKGCEASIAEQVQGLIGSGNGWSM